MRQTNQYAHKSNASAPFWNNHSLPKDDTKGFESSAFDCRLPYDRGDRPKILKDTLEQ